jgi:glycosyltransferase involved in cell wall biosynthesis
MLAFLRRVCTSAYQQADVIAPVNVFNRRWEVNGGADPDRIRTVYNGVDPEVFVPSPDEPAAPTIGWVGRIDPLKDVETLVRAFAIVRQRVPDARLRLFGPTPAGNEGYAETIHTVVAETGTGDAVSFDGPVRPVTSAYHASTVVALSSISEGLPYTVMEAMMCGRATVSTDVGGVAEVAGDGGLIVPPRNPQALADALIRMLENDALRLDLGRRARRRAMDMFRLPTMLANFQDIYDGLVRSPVVDLHDEPEPVVKTLGVANRLLSKRPTLADILPGTSRAAS